MRIDFTSRQYKALTELLKFNMDFFNECESTEYKEYISLIQYILGYEDLAKALESEVGEDYGSDDIAGEKLRDLKEAYDETVFWKGLCRRMVSEKLFEECEELNLENIEEYAEKRRTLEAALFRTFKSGEFTIKETDN